MVAGALAVLSQQTKSHTAAAGPTMERDMALTLQAELERDFGLAKRKVEGTETVDYNKIDCPV